MDETPHEHESPNKNDGELKYQEQKDRYKGDIDPVSKLRNGTGVYTYTNAFFQY